MFVTQQYIFKVSIAIKVKNSREELNQERIPRKNTYILLKSVERVRQTQAEVANKNSKTQVKVNAVTSNPKFCKLLVHPLLSFVLPS